MSRHLHRRWTRFPEHFAELRVEGGEETQACSRILTLLNPERNAWLRGWERKKEFTMKGNCPHTSGHELQIRQTWVQIVPPASYSVLEQVT